MNLGSSILCSVYRSSCNHPQDLLCSPTCLRGMTFPLGCFRTDVGVLGPEGRRQNLLIIRMVLMVLPFGATLALFNPRSWRAPSTVRHPRVRLDNPPKHCHTGGERRATVLSVGRWLRCTSLGRHRGAPSYAKHISSRLVENGRQSLTSVHTVKTKTKKNNFPNV